MARKIRLILLRGAFDKLDAMTLKTKANKLLCKSASPSPCPSSVSRSPPEAAGAGAGAGSVLVSSGGDSGKPGWSPNGFMSGEKKSDSYSNGDNESYIKARDGGRRGWNGAIGGGGGVKDREGVKDRDSIFEYEQGLQEMLWADVDDIRKAHLDDLAAALQQERALRIAAQTLQAETADDALRLEATLAAIEQQFEQRQAEVASREEELRTILSSAATHIGKLEEQVRLTNADVASMKDAGLAQQQLAETSLNHASLLALQREAFFSRERDAIAALNAHLRAELATANEEIKTLSSAVGDLESALESECLTSAVCEVAVARAVAACLASLEEVQLLASSTALELQIDQHRCVKVQHLLVLATDVSRLLIECNQVVAAVYSDLDTQQESHAGVVHRMQTVAAELEGRCWQTSGEQRRVIRTLRRCAMAAWRARTVRLNELRRLQDNMEARRAGRVVLRVLSVLLSACSLRKMSERARRAAAFASVSRGFRALQSRTLLAHRQLAAIRKCNVWQFSHLRLLLILWHTQLEKRRFRLRCERFVCVCGWRVEARLVSAAFANWREVGSEWNDRVEEVKRVLLASYAQDRKAICLRWVVLSRQLVEMGRFQCRSAHLAAKTAASARVSLLGRRWVSIRACLSPLTQSFFGPWGSWRDSLEEQGGSVSSGAGEVCANG